MCEDVHWYRMETSMFWVGIETNTFWNGIEKSFFWRMDTFHFSSTKTGSSDDSMHPFHMETKGGASHNGREGDIGVVTLHVTLQATSSQGFQSSSCTQQKHSSPYFLLSNSTSISPQKASQKGRGLRDYPRGGVVKPTKSRSTFLRKCQTRGSLVQACSLVPSPPPQLSSLVIRITRCLLQATDQFGSQTLPVWAGEGLGTRLTSSSSTCYPALSLCPLTSTPLLQDGLPQIRFLSTPHFPHLAELYLCSYLNRTVDLKNRETLKALLKSAH